MRMPAMSTTPERLKIEPRLRLSSRTSSGTSSPKRPALRHAEAGLEGHLAHGGRVRSGQGGDAIERVEVRLVLPGDGGLAGLLGEAAHFGVEGGYPLEEELWGGGGVRSFDD